MLACEPHTTAPKAASAEPTTKAIAKVRWMLIPSADVIFWSSTPARMTMPVFVRYSQSQRPMPTAIPRPSITKRASEYWTPQTWRSRNRSVHPGQLRLTALPPNFCATVEVARGKWAMIWSAMITEIAIVIRAWRSSWPWFQRRKPCCVIKPTTAMQGAATRSGRTHSHVFTSEVGIAKP
jgi:hypothetical protein